MRDQILLGLSVGIIAMLAVFGCTGRAPKGEFTADMVETVGDNIKSGKIYVKGSRYRMELQVGPYMQSYIVDQDAGTTHILRAAEKVYGEMASDMPPSLNNDPFRAVENIALLLDARYQGKETVNGYECEKTAYFNEDGNQLVTQWVSPKLAFPIRILAQVPIDKVMELKNIQEVAVDDALFEIPQGYTRFKEPPIPVPEWAEQILPAPVMEPPFVHEMSAGEMIRVKVQPGKSIWVNGQSENSGGAEARAIPFLVGRPVETIEKCRNIALGGSVPYQINRTVREADEVVIRVFDGDAMITVKALDMHEKHVSAGEEYRVPLLSRERIELRIVNLVSEESICKWDFYEQGGLLGDDRVGPAKYRSTKSLKEENNVERSLRKAWGDEMVFRVEQGAVLIKLGQHNTLEFWQ